MIARAGLALVALALLLVAASAGATPAVDAGRYLPRAGDSFSYAEEIVLGNGAGDYSSYTEHTFINGSIAIVSVASNESATTDYASSAFWFNDTGATQPSSEHGTFGFSASSYLYVNGTDNQTGYSNPSVWFYIDNTVPVGGTINLLNTPMSVDAVNASYPMASSATGYVATIRAEGNGSYNRDDVYGQFTATYTWVAYFDPSTGYIVGYDYTEHDTNTSGDGFTWTDTLTDTHTSFPLTEASVPPPSAPSSSPFSETVVVLLVVVIVIIVAVVVLAYRARRRRSSPGMTATNLPRHTAPAAPPFSRTFGSPPPVQLIPGGQPAVQQIVIKEIVKVPCRYCGTLIDSTATVCPNCGAPRT
jgi:hypothetical protein